MLQTRHFSNRLLANKLGRTFSTNWRSSSTKIFCAQFSQIQSANGCSNRCIILPKFKELCQRHQFCSTMADGGSIPPSLHSNQQSANSYPSQISSHKISTNGNSVQKIYKLLEYRQLYLNNFRNKIFRLILKENRKTGQKLFKLTFFNKDISANIPGILMPDDVYPFVREMDNLMGELASRNIDPHKYKGPLTTSQSVAAPDSANSKQMMELISVFEFTGQTRKFQLGLVLFPDDDKRKRAICFQTRISSPLKSENGKWSYLTLPLHALPWLRREMAEILAKYDGKEAAQIPEKFFNRRNDDVNNSPPPSSFSIPSTKMQIINAEKMKIPSRIIGQRTLDLNKFHNKFLRLCLKEGSESKEKFFQIMIINNGHGHISNFSILPVPQDAYAFVGAMDELIGELAVENFDVQKFIDTSIESAVDEENDGFKQKHDVLKFAEFTGQTHKFQLELVHFPNPNQVNGKMQIFLQMDAFELSTKKRKWMTLPLEVLPWLRAEMTEMLIKYDGKEAAQIPRKSIWNDAPRFAPQKLIFDGKFDRQIRPQIENKIPPKMPTTFPPQQKYSKMEPKIQRNNSNRIWNKNQPEMGAAQFDPQIAAEVEQSLRDAILDTKQLRNKRAPRKIEDPMNPTMADLEESLRILFDFEDEKEDSSRGKKYGREATNNGRRKFPRYEF